MLLFFLQAANAPASWNENAIVWATIVIAASTVISVIATILLWLTTKHSVNILKDSFEASHRPYVSLIRVEMGEPETTPKRLMFTFEFKNVGSVPAHDFHYSVRVIVDGHVMPMAELEVEPVAILFPHTEKYCYTFADDPKEIESIENSTTLSLIMKFTYKGMTNKTYSYEEKLTYNPHDDDFDIMAVSGT